MLDRARQSVSGISRRLIASYVLVTVTVVVLVEAFVLGYQVPHLLNDAQLQAQVRGTAQSYWGQLAQRYPSGVPAGTLLGQSEQHPQPGATRTKPDGTLIVPAVTGAISSHEVVTAMVAVARDGTIIASSIPSRYPAGQPAARELPSASVAAIRAGRLKGASGGTGPTRYGTVSWTLYGGAAGPAIASGDGQVFTYLYVQAPPPAGFVDPIRAWDQLGRLAGGTPLSDVTYALLIILVPLGVGFGLLATLPLVRRVRRLERASVAVTGGDYTVSLPLSGRDEVGRLEANLTAMTSQLSSAVAAERERATSEARAAERSRIAREIHDAISQHLFGLRMVASGMRRADPDNEQVQAIERITHEAERDMQALLWELRPAGIDGAGLTPALQQVCAAYRDRLGVTVDADLAEVTLPERVEDALLRITQEACTNAVRHGNAHRLAVSVARQDGQVELAVRDDGTGFDPAASHAGSGLQHIRDRVSELGGTVDIDSTPGAGSAVTVRVPAP